MPTSAMTARSTTATATTACRWHRPRWSSPSRCAVESFTCCVARPCREAAPRCRRNLARAGRTAGARTFGVEKRMCARRAPMHRKSASPRGIDFQISAVGKLGIGAKVRKIACVTHITETRPDNPGASAGSPMRRCCAKHPGCGKRKRRTCMCIPVGAAPKNVPTTQ